MLQVVQAISDVYLYTYRGAQHLTGDKGSYLV